MPITPGVGRHNQNPNGDYILVATALYKDADEDYNEIIFNKTVNIQLPIQEVDYGALIGLCTVIAVGGTVYFGLKQGWFSSASEKSALGALAKAEKLGSINTTVTTGNENASAKKSHRVLTAAERRRKEKKAKKRAAEEARRAKASGASPKP